MIRGRADAPLSNPADRTALILRVAAGIALSGIALLFVMILAFALPLLARGGAGSPFSWIWLPYRGYYGILPMLAGSLLLAGTALFVGWPLALGVCCRTLTAGHGREGRLLRGTVRFMTAIPTVVYGFAAMFLLTPIVRQAVGGTGLCWLSAGIMLTLLILPTMILVLEAGIGPRLDRLALDGAALGFTRTDLLWLFVLPASRNCLIGAAVLGFGRAVGDTLIALMLAGNVPLVPTHPGESLRTLTAHMALVTANEVGGAAYGSLFAAGALLLLINAAVGLLLRRLDARP